VDGVVEWKKRQSPALRAVLIETRLGRIGASAIDPPIEKVDQSTTTIRLIFLETLSP
jgi:hypothetical protein